MFELLMKLVEANDIQLVHYNFKHPRLEAMYMYEPFLPPIIGLSKKLRHGSRHFTTILAHELGHFYTTYKGTISYTYCHYKDRIAASRDERRASLWAAKFLIPEDRLQEAVSKGLKEVWELAEFFGVDEELVRLRMRI